jgi:hypothetical protein
MNHLIFNGFHLVLTDLNHGIVKPVQCLPNQLPLIFSAEFESDVLQVYVLAGRKPDAQARQTL